MQVPYATCALHDVSTSTLRRFAHVACFHSRLWLALQGNGAMGAGDLLMSFLGVVILSFGFRIFGQRRLMRRHAPEIFGATTLSAAFSMFSTAYAAKVLGLAPGEEMPACACSRDVPHARFGSAVAWLLASAVQLWALHADSCFSGTGRRLQSCCLMPDSGCCIFNPWL